MYVSICHHLFIYLEIGPHCIAQAGLELRILLPVFPECRNYSYALLHPALYFKRVPSLFPKPFLIYLINVKLEAKRVAQVVEHLPSKQKALFLKKKKKSLSP
jgi:hypothetical protein